MGRFKDNGNIIKGIIIKMFEYINWDISIRIQTIYSNLFGV